MKGHNNLNNHLSLNARPELIEMIANLAEQKNVKESLILEMMEDILTKIAVLKYGDLRDIRVRIHKTKGAILVEQVTTIVEKVEDPYKEISVEDAQKIDESYQVGDVIVEELPPLSLTRSMMQKSLSALTHSIKELEKTTEYNTYKDNVGSLVSGVVKRTEFGAFVLDLGNNAEGYLFSKQTVFNEKLTVGDRVRALIIDVKENPKGAQILLSRTHPNFIVKLFWQEIPEIFDGVVEIKALAREPGGRTKIVVHSNALGVDPIGVCIGYKGAKINGILDEIKGEKIDLIKYSEDFLTQVENAFWPTKVLKISIEEETETISVVVDDAELRIVIGRGGQNIRLISKLLRWNVEAMTVEEEKEKRQKRMQVKIAELMETLDVDEVVAHLLLLEGFSSAEELAEADISALLRIEDFTEDLVQELIVRAKAYLAKHKADLTSKLQELQVQEDLLNFDGLKINHKVVLGKNDIKSLQDLADLSSFELLDILQEDKIPMKKIEQIIMSARSQTLSEENATQDDKQE